MAAEARAAADYSVVWEAQDRQAAFIACPIFEVFFGGARGGGKTDAVLGDFLEHADAYGEHAIGLMVRRQRTELIETIERSRSIYTPLSWQYHEQDKMWRAPNGARLRFAYLERDADAEGYQGHSYTRVYVEEIGNFPSERPILKLMATLRSGAGVPVGFRATGNPGGPGHQWVKRRYIDPAPAGWRIIRDPLSGLERVYIPSRVTDNVFLGDQYIQQLKASGSDTLVRAWLDGDWSVIEGAFFDCWSTEKHVVRPFAIPKDWLRFRSADWGSAKPFSVGWWAVASDDYRIEGHIIPRGALIRYREWYGSNGQPNVGLKLTADEVAEGIVQREKGDNIAYGVLDPAAFAVDGGPSIAERMAAATKGQVWFKRADNRRVAQMGALGGWDQMRRRLQGDGDGRPMLYVFSTCADFIRTVPALQHDPDRPEDVDTDGEDHCFTGDTLVRTSNGLYSLADLVGSEGNVWSDDGQPHRYRSARMVKANAEIMRLIFSDGSEVRCTPDHKFLTTQGWVQAQYLSSLSLKPFKSSVASGSTSAGSISSAREFVCIASFGKRALARYRTAITSTTRTLIGRITSPRTWRALSAAIISRCMELSAVTSPAQFWTEFGTGRRNGMVAPLALSGTGSITCVLPTDCMLKSRSSASTAASLPRSATLVCSVQTPARRHGVGLLAWMTSSANALFAALGSLRTNIRRLRRAHANAVRLHRREQGLVCLSVKDAGRADVYCLTVPDTGNFVLANGAIVSNCGDEGRYACMSRPWVEEIVKPKDVLAELIKPKTLNDVIREYELEHEAD